MSGRAQYGGWSGECECEAACTLPSCPRPAGESGCLYCSRLMSWPERLRTLADIGKWRLGLWHGLEFLKVQRARKAGEGGGGRRGGGRHAPGVCVWGGGRTPWRVAAAAYALRPLL